jgi:hypothetical protein
MVGPQQPPQVYPLGEPKTGTDKRFTFGVVLEVADVLTKHGYPDIVDIASGADVLNLQTALFTFIYGPANDSSRHAVRISPQGDYGGER